MKFLPAKSSSGDTVKQVIEEYHSKCDDRGVCFVLGNGVVITGARPYSTLHERQTSELVKSPGSTAQPPGFKSHSLTSSIK